MVGDRSDPTAYHNNDYLAERSRRRRAVLDHEHGRVLRTGRSSNQITDISTLSMQAGLSMVVWILKREVRAIGGCLGIHRR